MAQANSLEEHLNCAICLELFNDPRALKCLHSFCYDCILQLKTENNTIPCPECREVSNVNDLRKDFRIQAFLDIHLQAVGSGESTSKTVKKPSSQNAPVSKPPVPPKKYSTTKYSSTGNSLSAVCDSCNQHIYQLGFKCFLCEDYDLCRSCESNGQHQHHPMCRITDAKYRSDPVYAQKFRSALTPSNRSTVICDCCGEAIAGLRFKCFLCDDYDLCEKCEAAGWHKGHPMCRIRTHNYACDERYSSKFRKLAVPRHSCDFCQSTINGLRLKCCICFDYDLCENCNDKKIHEHHPMCRIRGEKYRFDQTYLKMSQSKEHLQSGSTGEYLHAFCDRCRAQIYGLRFKCCVCDDYDLCKNCEKYEGHLEHPMVRIRQNRYLADGQYLQVIYG